MGALRYFGFIILGLAIYLAPQLLQDSEYKSYNVKPPIKVVEDFTLDKAEIFIQGSIIAPESIAIRGDEIYTGDLRGRIYRVKNSGDIKLLAEYGYPCPNTSLEVRLKPDARKCSYPLAFRFAPNGQLLYFTDPYKGILRIDTDTGITEVVVDMAEPIEGKYSGVPEDLDITKDGDIYWSDGTTTVRMGEFEVNGFIPPSGRLLKYDSKLKKSIVLLNDISFSNGVQLSADETFVLVAETFGRKILRYYINGDKKGQTDVFIDGLPGYPDNLRSNGKGGFYIALILPRHENFTLTSESLSTYPRIRRFIVGLRYFLQEIIFYVTTENSLQFMKELYEKVGHFGPWFDLKQMPKEGLVLEVDGDGKPIKLLKSSKETLDLSQFTVGSDYAYASSPFGTTIWRIKTSDL